MGSVLGVRISSNPEKYLGLPTMIGRQKKAAFANIRARLVQLIDHWSLRFLSMGGSQQTTSTSSVFYAKLWQSNIPSKCNITTQILLAFHITIPAWFPNMDWLTWLGSCVSSLSNTDCVLFFITMWAVWGVRNKLIHKSISPDIAMVVSFIKNYVAEFEASQVVSYKPSLSSSSRWLPPSGNLIKVNFDTVFDSHMLSSSSGIVFRNHEGLLLAVAVYPHSHIPNPCVAEAQACLDAISLAKDLFFCNIIIEGDSLTVINKLQSGSNDMSLIGMILSDVKSLSKFFEGVTFNFVSRACNEVAHKTALLDRNSASFLVWVEEAPTVIEAAAEKDQRWVDPPD
ncbi:hypothetical protein V6N13_039524 [Hibiscus sabdariffa]